MEKSLLLSALVKKRINDFQTRLERYSNRVSKNAKIVEKKRSSPIMHGFHIEVLNEKNG